jgi:CubicO group peptidase (beta-lactamase class C family)
MTPAFDRSLTVLNLGITEGLHLGAQLYVSLKSQVLIDSAVGEARPGVPMTPDSLNLWFSSTKPVAAVAIVQLWERGLLELDDPVIRFIPEFGQKGKEAITIRHILTHTAGFRAPPRSENEPWERIIAELCAARQEAGWLPGKKAGYHPASSWYILGEIVRRVDGRDYCRYARQMIFEPTGMRDSWVGMPADTFRVYGDRIAIMQDTTKLPPEPLDVEAFATSCRPGSGGWGPIRELGKFYEMLMNRGVVGSALADGTSPHPEAHPSGTIPSAKAEPTNRILRPQSVEAITARHRTGMIDVTFKTPIDWGLGFLLNSAQPQAELPYGYGPYASARTFGHGGAQSSGGFCDPERGLVVAYAFNGRPGEGKHHERRRTLLEAVEKDLLNADK